MIKQIFSRCLTCFYSRISYLWNFKCSFRATLGCLAGRMWPAVRTLPRPAVDSITFIKGLQILCANFSYVHCFSTYMYVTRKKLPKQRLYEKFVRLTLMKLTTECESLHLVLELITFHSSGVQFIWQPCKLDYFTFFIFLPCRLFIRFF